MFTYVETMRKTAIKIMSRTFGAKFKSKGIGQREGIYDQYPLRDFVHLLCFEDLDEAKAACQHYNIHVRKASWAGIIGYGDDTEEIDVIYWRHSDFREPKDPTKGHTIHLKPRKMNRVIESKLNGMTRLAICRGEASGVGATLDMDPEVIAKEAKLREAMRKKREEERVVQIKAMEAAAREAALKKRKEELMKKELLRRQRKENERKEKLARELEARKKEEQKRQLEIQMKQQSARKAEAERRRAQEAAAAALQAEKLKREEEERQRIKRADEERKRIEAEKLERERQAKLQREREEKARQELLRQKAEQERLRKIEEERQRQLKLQREREAELERQRRIKAEEERKVELEWQRKINFARKVVTMKRWCEKLSAISGPRNRTKTSIETFNPLSSPKLSFHTTTGANRSIDEFDSKSESSATHETSFVVSYEEVFYQLGTDTTSTIDMSNQLFTAISSENLWQVLDEKKSFYSPESKSVILFKVGIIINDEASEKYLSSMVKFWIDARLQVGKVRSVSDGDFEVRTVVSNYDCAKAARHECDAVLIIVLPVDPIQTFSQNNFHHNTPQFVLDISNPDLNVGDFDRLLNEGCEHLTHRAALSLCAQQPLKGLSLDVLEKISLRKICFSTLRRTICLFTNKMVQGMDTMHRLPPHLQRSSVESRAEEMAEHCRNVILFLLQQLTSLGENHRREWPAIEFIADKRGEVPNYFLNGEGGGLPVNWRDAIDSDQLQEVIWGAFPSLSQPINNSRIDSFLHDILDDAPVRIQQECGKFWQNNDIENCLEVAFQWNENIPIADDTDAEFFVYLPVGYGAGIIDQFLELELKPNPTLVERQEEEVDEFLLDEEDDFHIPSPSVLNDHGRYATPLVQIDDSNNALIHPLDDDDKENEMMEPTLLPFASPSKRSMPSPISSDRKRFKSTSMDSDIDTIEKPVVTAAASDDLKKCREFTAGLQNMYQEGSSQMAFISADPNLSKLVESDKTLKKLLQKII